MLYVYAFVEPPASVPDVLGVASAPLETQTAAGLDVVVSRTDGVVEASDTAVLEHARVVDAVAAGNDAVLPARFGGVHADADALRAAVEERAAELADALERVRGCVELGVRAVVRAGERVAARSGGEYMRARLDQRQETERLAAELHSPLAELARQSTRTVGATERLLLSSAYLVPTQSIADFRALVERLQAAHPQVGVVCTGPWPPYSFVTAEAS